MENFSPKNMNFRKLQADENTVRINLLCNLTIDIIILI